MLDAIREIINPAVVIEYDQENGQLKLKEDGLDSKIRELIIKHIPDGAFAFTLDHQPKQDKYWFQQLSSYVRKSNDKGVNQ